MKTGVHQRLVQARGLSKHDHIAGPRWADTLSQNVEPPAVFLAQLFQRIASLKSLLYESGCLN